MLTVVPSRLLAARLADAAMGRADGTGMGSRGAWTADVVTLPELVGRILAEHPDPRDRLTGLSTAFLLDELVDSLEPEVRRLFGPGAERPGAARAIGAAIREIRGAGLEAADLVPAVSGNRRLQALTATLDAFERRLAALDRWDEAAAIRAATALARDGAWPAPKLDAFEVAGLYDVTPLQGELLTAVARGAGRVRVRIPFQPEDPDATAYAFPFVHLWERLDDPALDIEIVYPDEDDAPRRVRFATPDNPTDEARLVAGWARRRIDAGARAEEISIVLAGGATTARRVGRELARRGVAHHARRAALLTETPTLAAALLPFRLIEEGFRRADIEALIASPLASRLDPAALLPWVRRGPAPGGPAAAWGRVLREARGEAAKSLNLALQRVEGLGRSERAPSEFWPAYGEALAAAGIEPAEGERQWDAWHAALRELREGLEAVDRWDGPPAGWRFHRRRLLDTIAERRERLGRSGRGVALLTPRDGRALRYRHTAVIGLSRGSLTGRDAAAQVLGDRERRALNELAGARLFRLSAEAMREGALLLAERMRETEEELVLSCPLENDDSTPLLPALEYEATRRALGGAAEPSWSIEAPAWRLGRSAEAVARLQTLERDRATFLGREPEGRRGDGGPFDGAFGERRADALLGLVPEGRLGRWSASQLESWRQCPHQFFQRYVLRLRRPDESSVEAEANAVGILVHRALHLLYEEGIGADPPGRERIEAVLSAAEEAVDVALRGDPAVWAATRRRTAAELVAYLRHVAAKAPPRSGGARPAAFELGFGLDEGGPPAVAIETAHGRVALRGRLDRLDREAGDGALHVLDYKHSKKRKSHQEAVDESVCGIDRFQLYAYFLAAIEWAEREGFGSPPRITGAIHCVREPRILGALEAPDPTVIRERIAGTIGEALSGRYDPTPRDRDACGWCDFRRSCRIALVAPGDSASTEPEEDA